MINFINSVSSTSSSNYTADSAFLNYTGSESDRSSREVIGGDDGNTSLYCRVSAAIENVDGTDKLVVRSNGVPNYTPKVGSTIIQGSWSDELSVSSDGNPNIIGEQDYTFTIPLIDVTINPVNTESDDFNNVTETALSAIGVSSNGVPIFNPWHNNQGDFLASSRDAITFATFSSCCGHPSGAGPGRTGAGPYHYHKYPTCIALVDILVGLYRAETLADAAQFDIHENRLTKKTPLPPDQKGATGMLGDQPPTLIEPAIMPARIASTSAFKAAGTALSKV